MGTMKFPNGIMFAGHASDSGEPESKNDFIRAVRTTHWDLEKSNNENRGSTMYHFNQSIEIEPIVELDSGKIEAMTQTLDGAVRVGHTESPHLSYRLGDVSKENGFVGRARMNSMDPPSKDEYMPLHNTLEDMARHGQFSDDASIHEIKIPRKRERRYDDVESPRSTECTTTLYTCLSLGLMLMLLMVPAIFHICCQFRLYGGIFRIPDGLLDGSSENRRSGDQFSITDDWTIIDHFGEFENFFFIGVFAYILIQLFGYCSTRARFKRYIHGLCAFSLDSAKHDFLYNNKQHALEYFRSYVKRIYKNPPSICVTSEQSLMKAFDEASIKFDASQVNGIWNRIGWLRFKLLLCNIYIPFSLMLAVSIGICTYVYDRRFRMHHRVPLAHPELISNLYWYAALQYEGVWCIGAILIFNLLSWIYLCYVNSHDHLYGMLDYALPQTQAAAQTFAIGLSKDIWSSQMLLFSSTAYAIDTDSVLMAKGHHKAPVRLGTISSSINFNPPDQSKEEKRSCLCQCLFRNTDTSDYDDGERSLGNVGVTPFDNLLSPLLEGKNNKTFKRHMRHFFRTKV
ncbi:hypothetical protein BdWA1_000761 [Babesia duncani]|uniref:Uncharacterized protein n=1 Tax=Babesia duncani TaxID=323732 RepID=A0AAD9PNS3_9APIC|nr:hypothetical protein BdWA1_000761 [Babesia duncani]